MDGTIGYCPIPTVEAMDIWVKNEGYVLGNSTSCNTLDRNNMRAHFDCGIGESTTLEEYAEAKTIKEYWPYIQDEDVKECLITHAPWSYKGLDVSFGKQLVLPILNLLGGLLAFHLII